MSTPVAVRVAKVEYARRSPGCSNHDNKDNHYQNENGSQKNGSQMDNDDVDENDDEDKYLQKYS